MPEITSNWFDQIYGPQIKWMENQMQGMDMPKLATAGPNPYGLEGRINALQGSVDDLDRAINELESRLVSVVVPNPGPTEEPVSDVPAMSNAASAVDNQVANVIRMTNQVSYIIRSLAL